ncbi:MAG: recombination protein O N-terminal domain-containing protein [Magnetococcales bacterium]|nr:recombination protein O N-terminal domain-containing protein [Magnetococcales bacterium]
MRIEDEALLLRRIPFRDASWVVVLLTRRNGTLTAAARDARRGRDEARAALSGFHSLRIDLRARGVQAMANLHRVEITRARHRLPFLPVASAAAQLLGEAVYRHVPPGDGRQEEVHGVLEGALDALDAGGEPLPVTAVALGRLAWRFGYGWRVDACAGCGGGEGQAMHFSLARGLAVCAGCAAPHARRPGVLPENVRRAMAVVEWPAAVERLPAGDIEWFYRMLVARLTVIGGRPLAADRVFRRLAGVMHGRSAT